MKKTLFLAAVILTVLTCSAFPANASEQERLAETRQESSETSSMNFIP